MDNVRIVIRKKLEPSTFADFDTKIEPTTCAYNGYSIPKVVYEYLVKETELKILKKLGKS